MEENINNNIPIAQPLVPNEPYTHKLATYSLLLASLPSLFALLIILIGLIFSSDNLALQNLLSGILSNTWSYYPIYGLILLLMYFIFIKKIPRWIKIIVPVMYILPIAITGIVFFVYAQGNAIRSAHN